MKRRFAYGFYGVGNGDAVQNHTVVKSVFPDTFYVVADNDVFDSSIALKRIIRNTSNRFSAIEIFDIYRTRSRTCTGDFVFYVID